MAYCLPIAVIAIYVMQQTCQATTTIIEPTATMDTATVNMDSVTPTETMVAATEAAMTSSAGGGAANTATPATTTTAAQATISPTPTSAIMSSSTVVVPDIVGEWESWLNDCYPGCCNLKAGWVKKYNATRNCPHNRVCKPDNSRITSYKEMNCPAKCDKCSAGIMVKPFSFPLAISIIMAITAYVLA